jgi:hypothetical protein
MKIMDWNWNTFYHYFKHQFGAGVPQTVQWLGKDWTTVARFPAEAGIFSFRHRAQSGSEILPASYEMGTRGSVPGDKQPGREGDHSASI